MGAVRSARRGALPSLLQPLGAHGGWEVFLKRHRAVAQLINSNLGLVLGGLFGLDRFGLKEEPVGRNPLDNAGDKPNIGRSGTLTRGVTGLFWGGRGRYPHDFFHSSPSP